LVSIDHYENFPVASWLCPPHLRPAITAIYHFARTADDLADEGDADPAQRLADLAQYRLDLQSAMAGGRPGPRWVRVFEALATEQRAFDLPVNMLHDLLNAFEQDVHNPRYPDRASLLGYCRLSANPVGRLLLHLYGIQDEESLRQSDAICSALQLINFWQDLSRDLPTGRCYIPHSDLARHQLSGPPGLPLQNTPQTRELVRSLVDWSRELMEEGAPLATRVPGRAGWELRLVVQGGLRILEKISAMDHSSLTQRPRLGALDAPLLLWRACSMPKAAS
jgi:squalene synthase HpnC